MIDESYKEIYLGVVLGPKGQVLIVERKEKEKGSGDSILSWVFPGGGKLEKETIEETLKRELVEETGYQIKVGELISQRIHPQFPVEIYYFSGTLLDDTHGDISDPEISRSLWINPKDIRNYFTSDLDPGVAKYLGL